MSGSPWRKLIKCMVRNTNKWGWVVTEPVEKFPNSHPPPKVRGGAPNETRLYSATNTASMIDWALPNGSMMFVICKPTASHNALHSSIVRSCALFATIICMSYILTKRSSRYEASPGGRTTMSQIRTLVCCGFMAGKRFLRIRMASLSGQSCRIWRRMKTSASCTGFGVKKSCPAYVILEAKSDGSSACALAMISTWSCTTNLRSGASRAMAMLTCPDEPPTWAAVSLWRDKARCLLQCLHLPLWPRPEPSNHSPSQRARR